MAYATIFEPKLYLPFGVKKLEEGTVDQFMNDDENNIRIHFDQKSDEKRGLITCCVTSCCKNLKKT